MSNRTLRATAAAVAVAILATARGHAQAPPVNGMRPADLRAHAIVDARVVVAPGRTLERATVLIRDGVIVAVGADAAVPADARVWSGEGLTVYPGLIDAAVPVEIEDGPAGPGDHWNGRVRPQRVVSSREAPSAALRKSLRGLGFTAAAVYPDSGIFRGTGAVLALAEETEHVLAYRPRAAMAMSLEHGGSWRQATYPGSLMGAMALIRQTLHDARWHAECRAVHERVPGRHEPPIRADALVALDDVLHGRQAVLFDVDDEHDALRAARLAEEFGLDATLLGSGTEFQRLAEVAAAGLPLIVPLKYPDRPELNTLAQADRVTLREMMAWEQALTNVRRLLDAGATVALTTHRLEKRSGFPAALRRAIRHGLSEDDALAALTVTPARLLGLEDLMGTVETGRTANLVVVKGGLFEKGRTIRDVWINGRRHEINAEPAVQLVARGTLETGRFAPCEMTIDTKKKSAKLHLDEDRTARAKKVVAQQDRISFIFDGEPLEVEGFVRFSGVLSGGVLSGRGVLPDGAGFVFTFTPTGDAEPDDDDADAVAAAAADDEEAGDADDETPDETRPGVVLAARTDVPGGGDADTPEEGDDAKDDAKDAEAAFVMPPDELLLPLGAYGLAEPPAAADVLVVNAKIWTAGPRGIIENGSMLVRDGKIAAIGKGPIDAPGVPRLDAAGRHVTPGLIDCHSHTGIHGGVNEWTQTNTAEVGIGDCINPDDVNWYRQLAGGLTAANQLHGSANPIGGQNSVVKLKWGRTATDFAVDTAIPGIKFALGENVKRSENRYPDTRMGVETFIRDAFTAARHYRETHARYAALPTERRKATIPPRRDLELDTLVEILEGRRIIHCHSYRQDEILMLIRVAEDFGFTIGTFQHVLEGYKVADAIAAHGAGGSSFSDWWAYKMEVYDAIPYNGALMTEVGVTVSFNSDSSELARRMNAEAAKAVRYGGLEPHEALKLVTINPAKQLRIDDRTGSLETGKDADFVVWSGDPLSTYTICEQTWVEGVRYFEREQDLALRERDAKERQRLVQKILADAHSGRGDKRPDAGGDGEGPGRGRWRGRRNRPTRLMARVLDARRQWMEEQARLGNDPDEILPGRCACSGVWWMLQSGTGSMMEESR